MATRRTHSIASQKSGLTDLAHTGEFTDSTDCLTLPPPLQEKSQPHWSWQQIHVKFSWQLATSGFHRGQYCSQPCLVSSLTIWTRVLSAPSVSLQMTPIWEVFICLRVGRLYRRIWIGGITGLRSSVWAPARPSFALWSQWSHAMRQAWGTVSGKTCGGKVYKC